VVEEPPVEKKKEAEADDKGEEFGPGAEPAGVPA